MKNHRCPSCTSAQAASLRARVAVLESQLTRARTGSSVSCARLSHDLQAIFLAIEGFAGVLMEQTRGSLTGRQALDLERVRAGALRGDSLMRGLARLSTVAGAEVQPRPVAMGPLVRQCIQELLPSLQQRSVEWELSPAPWPQVTADPMLLRIAIEQLLANAVKSTRGSAQPRIGVGVDSTIDECTIAVADNGDGFDPACLHRFFAPFERNGVGLALVKCIAQRHGGRVQAQARPGAGTLITMTLPRPVADAGSGWP